MHFFVAIYFSVLASVGFSQSFPLDDAVRLSEQGPQTFNTFDWILVAIVRIVAMLLYIQAGKKLYNDEQPAAVKLALLAIIVASSNRIALNILSF